jgi:hypothetical protein
MGAWGLGPFENDSAHEWILAQLPDRHAVVLRAKYGDIDVPRAIAAVFPRDSAVACVSPVLERA